MDGDEPSAALPPGTSTEGTSDHASAVLGRAASLSGARSGGSGSRRSTSLSVDAIFVAVATVDGLLYEYHVSDLMLATGGGGGGRSLSSSPSSSSAPSSYSAAAIGGGGGSGGIGPKAVLEGEWALQGSVSLAG